MESCAVEQRDALRSSELLGDLVKRATFGFGETTPGEGEGEQSRHAEEQEDVSAAELL